MVALRPHIVLHQPANSVEKRTETDVGWWHELLWIPAAGVLGFAITGVASWRLELSRGWLVAIYAPLVFALTAAYVHFNHIDLYETALRRWRWGVGFGVLFGALLILTVQRQDSSPRPEGWHLAWDVVWLGIVYGAADALLMNILPAMATWRVMSRRGWTESTSGKIAAGSLAILACIVVTVAVHAGYSEYQSADIRQPIIGNAINTLAFVLADNPIAALISHITMHIAAVFHGAETTVQLPPHYS